MVLDVDGNKGPIFGTMEAQKRNAQSYWVFLSHAAGYGKVPGNPCFFFSCEDMTPQVNNPGWVRALTEYVEVGKYGPPEMVNWDVADTRIYFPTGMSVFNIDWGDVGPISIDPEVSVIKGLVGFAPLPGGDQYWDYVAGDMGDPRIRIQPRAVHRLRRLDYRRRGRQRCSRSGAGLRRVHGVSRNGGKAGGHRRHGC